MPSRTSIAATLFGIFVAVAASIAIAAWDRALDARALAQPGAVPVAIHALSA